MDKTLQQWAGSTKMIALVFTDIVDSTDLGVRLGDERWIQLLRKHFARARSLMKKFDCYEIKIIGDSFMVAFRDAVQALDFAVTFKDNTGDSQIRIRAGVHVGPVRIVENDIFGLMVNYTKRIESVATDGGVVISDEAKTHIDYEKAARHSRLMFKPVAAPLKGFLTPRPVWRVLSSQVEQVAGGLSMLLEGFNEALTLHSAKNSPPQRATKKGTASFVMGKKEDNKK